MSTTGFASWFLIFLHLLIMCAHRSRGAEDSTVYNRININLKIQEDNNHDVHQDMHPKAHLHGHPSSHMDPQLLVFFTMNDLKEDKKIPIYFPKKNPATSPHLLPKDEADSIPFSSKKLLFLLQFFSISPGSPQAKAMEETLKQCQIPPIKGEKKFCATSLESMLDFTGGIFGLDTHFKILSTTHITKSHILFQNYTILKVPEEIWAPKMVACHTMPYPYAVFYCHSQESENRVFKVVLGGENGDSVEAVAVCHTDTSQWSSDHVSFRVLGIQPGTLPVCHFFPDDNFIFVPALAMAVAM